MIRFDETEEQHDQEIERLTEEINTLFVRADRSLKKITRPFIGGVPSVSPADRLVRLNTQRAIASRVQEISCTFRQRQKDYLQRLQVQKFGSEMFDPEEIEAATPESDQLSCFAKADMAIEMAKFNIQSRDAEIQRIAKSVAMLATVFKEVADMVIDQGTLIDRIDYNMDQVRILSHGLNSVVVKLSCQSYCLGRVPVESWRRRVATSRSIPAQHTPRALHLPLGQRNLLVFCHSCDQTFLVYCE